VLNVRTIIPLGILAVAIGLVSACSSKAADTSGKLCTPGAYVYCRCEDRSEGTKLCHDDGAAFDDCKCDGSGNDITSSGGNPPPDLDGGIEPVDSGGPTGGPQIEAACAGKLGVVAGDDTDTYTYMATYKGSGNWDASRGHPGIRSAATVLPVSGSLVATYAGTFQAILWTKLEAGAWSAPFSVGSAQQAGPPASVVFNGGVRLLYLGADGTYHMGTYAASGWDDATAVAEPTGGITVPGKSPPAVAAISTSVVMTLAGNDGTLARTTYSSSAWSTLGKFTGASAYESQPSMVALDTGGAKDLLLVYTGDDILLHYVTRDSATHTWGTAAVVDSAAATAGANPSETSLASMPGGKAMLVWRGSNNAGYYSVWDPAKGFAAPQELLAGDPELASSPVVTRGTCGSDVTVAYAKKDGGVELMRYAGGTWNGPFTVGGITKATYVGVGEMP
jgi:hypothetical protein